MSIGVNISNASHLRKFVHVPASGIQNLKVDPHLGNSHRTRGYLSTSTPWCTSWWGGGGGWLTHNYLGLIRTSYYFPKFNSFRKFLHRQKMTVLQPLSFWLKFMNRFRKIISILWWLMTLWYLTWEKVAEGLVDMSCFIKEQLFSVVLSLSFYCLLW